MDNYLKGIIKEIKQHETIKQCTAININIDMFKKHHFEGEYFADENSVKYDNQNGKIDTILFCDDKERAKLIASCLNLFETLQDNIELKINIDQLTKRGNNDTTK